MTKRGLIRALALVIAVSIPLFSTGCEVVANATNDSYTNSSTDPVIPLNVMANDGIKGSKISASVDYAPACGRVTGTGDVDSVEKARQTPMNFDRSSGVAAGSYFFQYILEVETRLFQFVTDEYDFGFVRIDLTETYPTSDGSPPCNAPYQAFINSATGLTSSVSVNWVVPEGIMIADSYRVKVNNISGDSESSTNVGAPTSHTPQNTLVVSSSILDPWISVTLETIKDGQVVFIDTMSGVVILAPGFILVDDHLTLVQGSLERATVDVLANDYLLEAPTTRMKWARLGNATVSILNPGGLSVNVNGERNVEVNAQGASPGQHLVVIETRLAGAYPQRQYLYVDYLEQGDNPPTLNDDSFIGFAGEAVILPVLDNDSAYDGGPLTIAGFTQPGGGATVTQNGDALSITGPVGEYSFSYTAQDQAGATATANVTVKLIKKQEAPAPVDCVADPFNPAC